MPAPPTTGTKRIEPSRRGVRTGTLEAHIEAVTVDEPPSVAAHNRGDLGGTGVAVAFDLGISAIAAKQVGGPGQRFELVVLDVDLHADHAAAQLDLVVE